MSSKVVQALGKFSVLGFMGMLSFSAGAEFDAARYVNHQSRVIHPRELLGKHYAKSVVKKVESLDQLDDFIYKKTNELLPARFKGHSKALAKAIL